MSISEVSEVMQNTLAVIIKMATPILLISITVGLIIAIFQAATQIHEQTLTFVPKLIAIAAILLILGTWMINTMISFMQYLFDVMIKVG